MWTRSQTGDKHEVHRLRCERSLSGPRQLGRRQRGHSGAAKAAREVHHCT